MSLFKANKTILIFMDIINAYSKDSEVIKLSDVNPAFYMNMAVELSIKNKNILYY